MSQFAPVLGIFVQHYLWKNYLDIQYGVSYILPNKKQVLIKKTYQKKEVLIK